MIVGLFHMLIACVSFAVMNTLVYQAKIWDPNESALTASFMRSIINLGIVVVMAYIPTSAGNIKGRRLKLKGLFGDMRSSLWLRGFFGTLSVITFFYAIHNAGVAEASLLNASNAIWVGLLGPVVLKQSNSWLGWVVILFGMIGVFLIYQPDFAGEDFLGRTVGLLSGVFAAIAYLMVSKSGRSNHPLTVVFYFTFVATLIHLICFVFYPLRWPSDLRSGVALLAAGVFASLAQIFMTKAYQEAPAALVASVSYFTPVLNLVISAVLYSKIPNPLSLCGAGIVVFAGMLLPFASQKRAVG